MRSGNRDGHRRGDWIRPADNISFTLNQFAYRQQFFIASFDACSLADPAFVPVQQAAEMGLSASFFRQHGLAVGFRRCVYFARLSKHQRWLRIALFLQ